MDDILSALDSNISELIFNNLIINYLSNKTRILVTHSIALVTPKADLLIYLNDNNTIICHPNELKTIINESKQSMNSLNSLKMNDSFDLLSNISEYIELSKINEYNNNSNIQIKQNNQLKPEFIDDFDINYNKIINNNNENKLIKIEKNEKIIENNELLIEKSLLNEQKIVKKEERREGDVPLQVYWFYVKACGGILSAFLLILICLLITVSL